MHSNLKFRHKVLGTAALVVLAAFCLFTLYNDHLQRTQIRASLEANLQGLGEVAATNIQSWLSGRVLLVESTAQAITPETSATQLSALLDRRALRDSFLFSYLGSANGEMTIHPHSNLPDGYDPRTRPWYQDAVASRGSILTEPYVDAATGKLIMSIASPAESLGVVAGDLSLETLVASINSVEFGGIGHAFLVNADGRILVHPDSQLVMKTLREVFPEDTPQLSPTMQETDGQIMTFLPVTGLPTVKWYLGLAVDKQAAYAPLYQFRTSAIVATLIAITCIITLLGLLLRLLLQPMLQMSRAMADIAQGEGDLTRRLQVNSNDEFGQMAGSFNQFVERIHTSISEVASATDQLNQVAKLVVNASTSSMANSDEQASRTNTVAAAINELGAAAQEIARNAADASQRASDAKDRAADGSQVLERTIRAMSELSDKISASCQNIEQLNARTVDIGKILDVIKGISEQTNLLALNAAIEAARAGEAGRGFAVVAEEVRNLAHRTQQSAQEVQTMIEELQVGASQSVDTMRQSQQDSQQSVEIANQAGQQLGSVTAGIGEIDTMNQSVAAATEEQTSVVDALNMDIVEINTLNQEGVENLQATLRACSALDTQAQRLKHLVDSFRI